MAAIEGDIIRDEQERSNLLRAMADVETAIAVSTPGTRRILENTLENAKKRVAVLDKKIQDAKVEHEAAEQTRIAAAAALVAKETALNAREREQYGSFLKEEFFTKKDFGKLEQFYAHSYDRLSKDGKDEMSHRIWEGARHKEYEFSELPAEVREREAKHAYLRLRDASIGMAKDTNSLPESDRSDFIKAYEAGNREAADKILERDTFRATMFRESAAKGVKSSAATQGQDAQSAAVIAATEAEKSTKVDETAKATAGLPAELAAASIDFGGMRPAQGASDGAVTNLPQPVSKGVVRGS